MPLGSYGFSIAVYVISIMIAVGGIALGLGYAFNEKRLKEFGREELFECALNGALVGGLFLLFIPNGPVTVLVNQLTLSNGTALSCSAYIANNSAMCLAYDYLVSPQPYTFMNSTHDSVLTQASELTVGLMGLNAILGLIGGVQVNLVLVQFSASAITAPLIREITAVVEALSAVAVGATTQAAVLGFAAAGSLTVLLPAGLVLRTFLPTRKLGGFLIAVAIGLYVVLPLSYVFDATLVNAYGSSAAGVNIERVSANATGVEGQLLGANSWSGTNSTAEQGALGSIESAASGLVNVVSGFIMGLLNAVAYFIVSVFVLPLFSLIMTGISIREMAELLGSEARFGNFRML